MAFSYWEYKSWFSKIDFTIVGSGITGLNCALRLRERFPKATILVLERGILPNGASTKNAGFACFGSVSEIIDDFESHSEEEVLQLIQQRIKGLQLLRKTLGDNPIGYKNLGGYELFLKENKSLLEECKAKLPHLNKLLRPLFKKDVFHLQKDSFNFKNIQEAVIFNPFEGQIDTGKMMCSLLKKCQASDINIINGVEVEGFSEKNDSVEVKTNQFTFETKKLLIATNGFAATLGIEKVKPARAQVLITKPIPNLEIKGTFHLDQGYYYFRNIDQRILLGGGRNLDFKTEETMQLGETKLIQQKLEELLHTTILPGIDVEIDRRWSGIMGVGNQKKPIIKQLSMHVFCGVRLGGMGIAIGSLVGNQLAELIKE